jgi:hypothetical protein
LGRAIERALGGEPAQVARMTVELERPVPIGRLTARVTGLRPGKRVRRIGAVLASGTTEVARATALVIRTTTLELPPLPALDAPPRRPPEELALAQFPFFRHPIGYHSAMELRFARGDFGQGSSAAWLRMRLPLVAGEEPAPLERVLVAADCGNAVSNVLDERVFSFVNPDLTVYLHRLPQGDWICLDAYTRPELSGIGLAHSRLSDRCGPIGHALQALLVAPWGEAPPRQLRSARSRMGSFPAAGSRRARPRARDLLPAAARA